jgi:hypothetical protein
MVAMDGYLYAFGGDPWCGSGGDDIERYDPASNTWSTIGQMSIGGDRGRVAAVLNGKVYITGGYSSYPNNVKVWEWSGIDGTFTHVSTLNGPPRGFQGFLAVGSSLWSIGGYSSYSNVDQSNDEVTTWTAKANLQTGRDYLGAAAIYISP